MKRHAPLARRGLVAIAALTGALFTTPTSAQPSAPAAPPAGAAVPPPGATPPAGAAAPPAGATVPRPTLPGSSAPTPGAPTSPLGPSPLTGQALAGSAPPPSGGADPLAAALAPQAGGLTPEEVGKIAAKTKHSVRAKRAELEAAAARVDQVLVTFFPRLSVSATYTRLSEVSSSGLGGGGALLAVQKPGPLLVGPCKADMTQTCFNDIKGDPNPVAGVQVSFPVLLNSTSFVASLSVPISDYVLRLSQGYASALHAEKGKKLELEAETLFAASDAKLAYFNWVRTQGQVVVAKSDVERSKARVTDANRAFQVGTVSRADVLRFEAQVAAAQQFQAEAEAFAAVAEQQLRIVLGLPSDRALTIGSDVMHEQGALPTETIQALEEQALARRLEIRALDETILSLKETVSLARAGYFPRIDAFADATLANPNQRIFPSQDRFLPSWDAGVRLSWTINDTFTALGATAEAKARVAIIEEQKGALRDGLRLEVSSAYSDAQKAAVSIEAAERQLAAAAESARVRNELFKNGKATSVDVLDAESEVTRAQLSRLYARIGLLVARVRLDHATGRDVPPRPAGE